MRKHTADIAALVLRIGTGLVFLPHGDSKVFGALFLIVGLLTRIDAFLLACTMGVAALLRVDDRLHRALGVRRQESSRGLAPDA